MSKTVKLKLDSKGFESALKLLRERLEAPEISSKVVQCFFSIPDVFGKLFRFERGSTVVGASLVVLLKPSDLLLDFLSTAGAVEFEGKLIEFIHNEGFELGDVG